MARRLARVIIDRNDALDAELEVKRQRRLAGTAGGRSSGRSVETITQDRCEVTGMVRGLTYLLGEPGNLAVAQRFIEAVRHG